MTQAKTKERKGHYYKGDVINLRAIKKEDYTEGMARWANDPDFNRYLTHGIRPTSVAAMEDLYEDLIKKDHVIFTVVDKKTEKAVGFVGIFNIRPQPRVAEYVIHIGEKSFWGTGAASEATDFILKYAFDTLNINKLWLGVAGPNSRAVRFYEKKGFKHEGNLRAEIFRENRYYSLLRMGMLREEYEKRNG